MDFLNVLSPTYVAMIQPHHTKQPELPAGTVWRLVYFYYYLQKNINNITEH